jgi:2-oxoglutarate dehydrogenase E2 component (dihydrolipoamide succinyltransferase)
MSVVHVVVPSMGESITEAAVARWRKAVGDAVKADEILVEIESDKITAEVPSPVSGVLASIDKKEGERVTIGEVIGSVDSAAAAVAAPVVAATPTASDEAARLSPSVRQAVAETGVDPSTLVGSGPRGRVTKNDVLSAAEKPATPVAAAPAPKPVAAPVAAAPVAKSEAREEIVPMTMLRQRIAERLVEAQQNAAILTTFNEVDMSRVMELRKRYQEKFEKRYGIKLGFMSFFVKACVEALQEYPAVNAEIRGNNIVYKKFYDISVAVGGGKGLVVPVIRGADQLGFAQIELGLAALAKKAKENKLTLEELSGGTFTISNGGIYGSLLSTPILNPPQTGILGMHKIEDRAVVVDGQIVVRPMMYLALSYDHRLIDGREAVQFLVRVKECIEDPERLLLEV